MAEPEFEAGHLPLEPDTDQFGVHRWLWINSGKSIHRFYRILKVMSITPPLQRKNKV